MTPDRPIRKAKASGMAANQTGVSMTELDDVFDSLNSMNVLQLLMAFVACTAYTLAQGGLIASRSRGIATVAALVAALSFILLGDAWARSTVLVAGAVAGIGAFVAMAWLLGRLFGSPRAPDMLAEYSVLAEDSVAPEPDAVAASTPAQTRPRRRAAASTG